eukprot:13268571-Heterocapsa_arctica.AAC.1
MPGHGIEDALGVHPHELGCRVGDCLANVDPLTPQRSRRDPGPLANFLDNAACHGRGAGLLDVVHIALHH